MAIETFKATSIHPGSGTRIRILARDHEVIADEPAELGGTDTGANPVELLLGALGACQSVVAQVYAERFGVSWEELRIELEGDIDLDGFFDAADVRPGFSEVRYRYVFVTNEPYERFEPFLDFVSRHCPVGDTIEHAVKLVPAGVDLVAARAA